ncbi:hypothetical protein SKAU_G00347010 [Synaphobranchus kaupii]|uniref:Otogelin-like/Mucin TIL domain-containing protein n=1 Tax=Synaphobranchus kaupii TaxID=118154 RepID=A0A9Q1EJV4_SYNKA|nr:hypothetical protein SKAU_G00347010 [Synaphobranchus kaupii]
MNTGGPVHRRREIGFPADCRERRPHSGEERILRGAKVSGRRGRGFDMDTSMWPRCQWRYESCVSACFRTCSDPDAQLCTTIPK